MFSLFGPKADLGMIFHIGSSSIRAGLIRLKKGELPHVVYTLTEDIPYHDKIEPERFLIDMIESLKRINLRVAKEGLSHLKFTEFGHLNVKHVFYIFASPWSVTQTKIASLNKPEGFVLTKEIVDKIVAEQERIFESETIGVEDIHDKLSSIEKRVIQIKLNGYESSDPYGKRVERADISLFVSLIPKSVIEKVNEVSMVTYHPRDTNIFSFPLATFTALRDVFQNTKDFMFLHVGGELTEISVIKDGLILETASFPMGRHFLLRKISRAFQCSVEESQSLLRLHQEGHGQADFEGKLKPVLAEAAKEWTGGLSSVFSALTLRMSLPTNLFAMINNDFVQFFIRALKEEKVSEFGISDVSLNVTLINHDKLKSAVTFGKNAEKEPFIAILSAFAGRIFESKQK